MRRRNFQSKSIEGSCDAVKIIGSGGENVQLRNFSFSVSERFRAWLRTLKYKWNAFAAIATWIGREDWSSMGARVARALMDNNCFAA